MDNVWLIVLGVGSFLGGLDPAWIALVGTLFGGVGLKVIEGFLSRKRNGEIAKADATRDYRAEIKELVERLDDLDDDVHTWRTRSYNSEEENARLRFILRSKGINPDDGDPPEVEPEV